MWAWTWINKTVTLRSLVRAGIERLRAKLLDLSMANRLLNFKHSDKSRSHIRVIDEIPELLFEKLDQPSNLQFQWIEEPDIEPADEQNDWFYQEVARAKESDQIYLEQREKLGRHVSKRQLGKLERALRDRVDPLWASRRDSSHGLRAGPRTRDRPELRPPQIAHPPARDSKLHFRLFSIVRVWRRNWRLSAKETKPS